jgi:hypothetical protein
MFRKKPVVITAALWDGTAEGATPIIEWILREGGAAYYHSPSRVALAPHRADDLNVLESPAKLAINTLEGQITASRGDWIIRGVQGEFYPCKPDIFAATYEEFSDD